MSYKKSLPLFAFSNLPIFVFGLSFDSERRTI